MSQGTAENRRSSQPVPGNNDRRLHIDLRSNQPIRQEQGGNGRILYAQGSNAGDYRFAELHHHIPPIKQYQNSRATDEFFSAAMRKSQK